MSRFNNNFTAVFISGLTASTISLSACAQSAPNDNDWAAKQHSDFAAVQRNIKVNIVNSPQKGLVRIRMTATNNSDIPIIVDATRAVLVSNKQVLASAKNSEQLVHKHSPLHTMGSFATAALSVGVIPSVQEFAEQKGPVLQRYGEDERRRATEEEMFGKVLLYPGTAQSGYVYFPLCLISDDTQLRYTVESYYEPKISSSVATEIIR